MKDSEPLSEEMKKNNEIQANNNLLFLMLVIFLILLCGISAMVSTILTKVEKLEQTIEVNKLK